MSPSCLGCRAMPYCGAYSIISAKGRGLSSVAQNHNAICYCCSCFLSTLNSVFSKTQPFGHTNPVWAASRCSSSGGAPHRSAQRRQRGTMNDHQHHARMKPRKRSSHHPPRRNAIPSTPKTNIMSAAGMLTSKWPSNTAFPTLNAGSWLSGCAFIGSLRFLRSCLPGFQGVQTLQ